MYSSESSSSIVADDEGDEDGDLYQLIFDMSTSHDKEEKEKVQIPPRDDTEDKMTPNTTQEQGQKEEKDTLILVKFSEVDNAAGLDMDESNNIQVIPVLEAKKEVKPWRKVGANISDYFNYGFNEESWKTYCKKQSKLRADNKKLYFKTKVQKGHNRHEMESCSACPSSGNPSIQVPRQSSATTDVTGEQPGPSSRVEERHCLRDENNTTQVVADMSPEEARIFYNLPPRQTFLFQRGPPPLSPNATLESRKDFDDPSPSPYPCSSGLSALIPKVMFSRAGLIENTKALAGIDRDRSRELSHDKDRKGGRGRDGESCSSWCKGGEEHMRHRDPTERGHRKRTHNDQSEGCQKTPRSSRGRRDDGEDRDSQSRPKHKKAKKRGRKRKRAGEKKKRGTNKTSSVDQAREFKSD